jgi:glutathione reductase (NADPH)
MLGELIHLFAFAMRFSITASEIRDRLYAFPTFSADVKSIRRALGRAFSTFEIAVS